MVRIENPNHQAFLLATAYLTYHPLYAQQQIT